MIEDRVNNLEQLLPLMQEVCKEILKEFLGRAEAEKNTAQRLKEH